MTFPVYLNLFGLRLHPHPVLEVLAYAGGFQLYLLLRRRGVFAQARVPLEQNAWIIVGCIFGALAGSKLLALAESFQHYWALRDNPFAMLSGKTIAGGLLGGWAGVEIAKRCVGVAHSTGDAFVFPLIVGMCVGRVGCFLTGLADHTHGSFTSVPWAINFGDGPRHPAQLYEIGFLLLLGLALLIRPRTPYPNGQLFRLFLLGYMLWRFAIEFLKDRETPVGPFSAIQIASLAGAGVCVGIDEPVGPSGRGTGRDDAAGGSGMMEQPTQPQPLDYRPPQADLQQRLANAAVFRAWLRGALRFALGFVCGIVIAVAIPAWTISLGDANYTPFALWLTLTLILLLGCVVATSERWKAIGAGLVVSVAVSGIGLFIVVIWSSAG